MLNGSSLAPLRRQRATIHPREETLHELNYRFQLRHQPFQRFDRGQRLPGLGHRRLALERQLQGAAPHGLARARRARPDLGRVSIDDQDITRSRIDVAIDATKIATRDEKRDEHLRSADFLDVANHPTVTFKSTRVERAGGDELRVTGDLTIRGTTRPVTLTVESLAPAVSDPWGNTKRGATARAKINRKDWGLQWNVGLEAGGVLVGEDVAIELEVELLKRKPA